MDKAAGSRAGARRAERPRRQIQPRLVALALAPIAGLAAWALLVWVAIGFGREARNGDGLAWLWLALVALLAVGVLFGTMMLVAALLRRLGILAEPVPHKH